MYVRHKKRHRRKKPKWLLKLACPPSQHRALSRYVPQPLRSLLWVSWLSSTLARAPDAAAGQWKGNVSLHCSCVSTSKWVIFVLFRHTVHLCHVVCRNDVETTQQKCDGKRHKAKSKWVISPRKFRLSPISRSPPLSCRRWVPVSD